MVETRSLGFKTNIKKKCIYRSMPFSIPTYFALSFLQNANLYQRRHAMKKFLKSKFIFASTFPLIGGVEHYNKFALLSF